MNEEERAIYSIGGISRMLGVPTATLRTWEERYGLVVPQRSPGGHRLYSRVQVELVRFVAERVESGMSPADAHRLLEERMAGVDEVTPADPPARDVLILVAEKDRFAADFSRHLLTTEGYGVEVVLDASAARERATESRPQVALVELLISGGEGTGLCRELKESHAIAVIAASSLDLRDEVLDAGADAFLLKPFDALELLATVKDLLGDSALVRMPARA